VKKHKQEEDIKTKGACCFNHIVGLPRKDGIEKPLFDYEWLLYRALLEKGYLNSNPKFQTILLIHSKRSTYGSRRQLD
jgi:hypothetical protein